MRASEPLRERPEGEQARVRAKDRMRVVKMDAVRPVVEPIPGDGEGEAK